MDNGRSHPDLICTTAISTQSEGGPQSRGAGGAVGAPLERRAHRATGRAAAGELAGRGPRSQRVWTKESAAVQRVWTKESAAVQRVWTKESASVQRACSGRGAVQLLTGRLAIA